MESLLNDFVGRISELPWGCKKEKKRNGTEDKTKIKIAIMIQKGIFVMSDCKP